MLKDIVLVELPKQEASRPLYENRTPKHLQIIFTLKKVDIIYKDEANDEILMIEITIQR